ncbi:hypothetical protein [Rhodococcus gordoniae]|uniref:hypothetical protein n=1 Tax=Rhodococcus gordoniae TaxID=223392 RepID=UPI0020CCF201|nr:hypothetical protein [Rhodococcus gordoniae]UTT48851.1 hypothetical protein NMQ04_01095 [Rhodococcus gordoniae]
MNPHAQLAARMIVAMLDKDLTIQRMVAEEVTRTGCWSEFCAALAGLAAAVCREIDDPDGARALWLHSVAAAL